MNENSTNASVLYTIASISFLSKAEDNVSKLETQRSSALDICPTSTLISSNISSVLVVPLGVFACVSYTFFINGN